MTTYVILDDDYIGMSEAESAGVEVLILQREHPCFWLSEYVYRRRVLWIGGHEQPVMQQFGRGRLRR